MSYQDETNPEPEYVVDTPAARITVTGPGGEVIQVIEVPARKLRRGEVDQTWLDAEQIGIGIGITKPQPPPPPPPPGIEQQEQSQ